MMNIRWHSALAEARVEEGGKKGLKEAADAVLRRAEEHVPLDIGTLRDTGRVSQAGDEAVVSYDTVYASILHEHPEYHFQHGREGKWLEKAVNASAGEIEAKIGGGIKEALL